MIGNVIIFSCVISTVMLVWFKSDAFIEYARLFKLNKFIKYDEYKNDQFSNPNLTYPTFLKTYYDKFILKLIGCRLCLNIWLSGLGALYFSTSIFSWIGWMSVLSILSLFIYGNIAKLLDENK